MFGYILVVLCEWCYNEIAYIYLPWLKLAAQTKVNTQFGLACPAPTTKPKPSPCGGKGHRKTARKERRQAWSVADWGTSTKPNGKKGDKEKNGGNSKAHGGDNPAARLRRATTAHGTGQHRGTSLEVQNRR